MKKPDIGMLCALFGCWLPMSSAAQAEMTVAPIFGDAMVLQRNAPLPIWGRATPHTKITVQFAGRGKTAVTDASGNWRVTFDALPASALGRELTISGDGTTQIFHDVLVGEVWLCAGQSIMEFPLKNDSAAKAALESADTANLRLDLWRYGTQWIYNAPFTPSQVETLQADKFYTNSWQPSSAQSAADFSAIGWFFGRELQKTLHVPVGMISLAAGGSPTEAWIRRDALKTEPSLSAMTRGNWLENPLFDSWVKLRGHQNLDQPLVAGLNVPTDELGPNHAFKPAMLWKAGVARMIPFAIRGVLWYQGESNSLEKWRVEQHEKLFPLLVNDWRAQWRQGDFPFYWVQLSGISTKGYQSQFWPEFRDQQRRFAQTLSKTGFAVSSDRGSENNVHPTNKHDVANRLTRVALAKTYGQNVEYSGPAPRSLKRNGNTLIVAFDHARGLKTADGQELRGFEIAAADGVFVPASAKIEGETVVLSSPQVLAPQKMRYGWQPFPDANLENADNLPASTFQLSLP